MYETINKSMNIYKVEQYINNDYDTYDSFVVIAETEQEARETPPSPFTTHHHDGEWYGSFDGGGEYWRDGQDWVEFDQIDKLIVTMIGIAAEDQHKGVVVASFNAG
jgi:hypothetical protein